MTKSKLTTTLNVCGLTVSFYIIRHRLAAISSVSFHCAEIEIITQLSCIGSDRIGLDWMQ